MAKKSFECRIKKNDQTEFVVKEEKKKKKEIGF